MADELDASQLSITNDRATILSKIDDDNQVVKVLIGMFWNRILSWEFLVFNE